MVELTEDEERWYLRAARSIAGVVKQTYEKDWMPESNCLDDDRFITKSPQAEWEIELGVPTDPQLEAICKQCPVSMQCVEWADKNNPTGVFIAGEWRE